jgi:hypothetical protein
MATTPSSTNATVGITAEILITVDDEATGAGDGRITYQILNNGDSTIYLGDSDVTVVNGFPIPIGGSMAINMRLGAILYAISDNSSQDIRIMKVA